MIRASRRTAGASLTLALGGLVAACGGGFGSAPAAPPDHTLHTYVALGDTFTAAPGVDSPADDDGCQRSHVNYPALAATALHIADVHDVSCAGATTAALTDENTPVKGGSTVPPQVDAVTRDTDLVTIGIGLADRDLLHRAFEICTALPCHDKVPPQNALDDASTTADALAAAVREIQDKAPDAYVVLVGYPKITPDAGSCDTLPKLDQAGLDAANQVLDSVNREMRSAARETGVSFLDVAAVSVGHELCSGAPWVEAPRGKNGPSTAFHPVAAEQRAVAEALGDMVRTR